MAARHPDAQIVDGDQAAPTRRQLQSLDVLLRAGNKL
jgi:hypothetical protein